MGGLRTYEPGTIAWVDLASRAMAPATEFYGGLFGWVAVSQGPAEETGGYAIFQLDGVDVAGVGPGDRPAWTSYVAVANIDETVARAEKHGATVVTPPLAVPSPLTNDVWPDDVPAHWMVYFATADTDATAAKVAELGGVVSVPPFDLPIGRIAVLNDPENAVFSVLGPVPAAD